MTGQLDGLPGSPQRGKRTSKNKPQNNSLDISAWCRLLLTDVQQQDGRWRQSSSPDVRLVARCIQGQELNCLPIEPYNCQLTLRTGGTLVDHCNGLWREIIFDLSSDAKHQIFFFNCLMFAPKIMLNCIMFFFK